MSIFWHSLKEAVVITYFVFIMMVMVDFFNVWGRGKMSKLVGSHKLSQYVIAPLLAVIPGCMGAFMIVSFFVNGMISFGSLAGGMITACGDEAFVMLTLFPKKALLLFGILLGLGIIWGMAVDWIVTRFKLKTDEICPPEEIEAQEEEELSYHISLEKFKPLSFIRFLLLAILLFFGLGFVGGWLGPEQWDWERVGALAVTGVAALALATVCEHYLKEHIWEHMVKHHLWKVFCWSLGAFLLVEWTSHHLNLPGLVGHNILWVLLLAGLVGLIPQSGPNLIFVVMFSQGTIPFSVLLANSMVQDGHGMLPLLSYKVRDAVLLKGLNLAFGLLTGTILYLWGF